jgi:hypothetical protein
VLLWDCAALALLWDCAALVLLWDSAAGGIALGLRCLGIALGLRCGGHWFGTELPLVECLVYFFKLISQPRKKRLKKLKKRFCKCVLEISILNSSQGVGSSFSLKK